MKVNGVRSLITVAVLSLGAQAQTATNVTAAFQPYKRVIEPVTIAQNYGGTEWLSTAFMDIDGPLIYTSARSIGGAWSTPQPLSLTNPFFRVYDTHSGDPWMIENQTDSGVAPRRMYVVGTSFSGGAHATDPNYCTHFNRIAVWWSDDGGQTWSYPFPVHSNDFGAGYFDDKPSALVSKYQPTAGLLYVAFARTQTTNSPGCPSGQGSNTIHVYRYHSGAWSSTFLSNPVTGIVTNPILFENPTTGLLGLAWMNFNPAGYSIDVTTSTDGGLSWAPVLSYPEPGLPLPPNARVCANSDGRNEPPCVKANIGLMGRFNPVTGAFGLVWHRLVGDGAQAMFATFTPGSGFSNAVPVSPNLSTHYTWNAAVDVDGGGNYLITYYDYDHGAQPNALSYFLVGTKRSSSGLFLADYQLFDNSFVSVASDPSIYGPTAEVGEYKDVFYWNGVLNATAVYMKNGRIDIYHVRATP